MKLTEIDWNAEGGAQNMDVEYPEKPIQDFVNWLRRSQRWRDDPRYVEERLAKLNQQLRDHREGLPVVNVQDRMAKAREALAAKRAADKLAGVGT